jgi:MFS family permease
VVANQLLWISFAPITSSAAGYYGVSDLQIGLLSLSFLVVYVFVSIPASWAIDTLGMRTGVGIGAALTGIFGLLRGLAASSYTLVLVAQIGIAIGQPFILNAITKVAARWFPVQERATAAGLGSLSIYLGILAGLALTPYLLIAMGMSGMLVAYGLFAAIAAIIFFIFARERPPTPPNAAEQEDRAFVLDGLMGTLRKSDLFRRSGGV